jgi:hypothetical protein
MKKTLASFGTATACLPIQFTDATNHEIVAIAIHLLPML